MDGQEKIQGKMSRYGINAMGLRAVGFVLILAGIMGRVVFENIILNFNSLSGKEIYDLVSQSPEMFHHVRTVWLLRAIEACAVPIFAYLLAEGFLYTSNYKAYLLRVLAVAVVSEIPFNLIYGQKFFDIGTRNPVFGTLLALIMLGLFNRFGLTGAKKVIVNTLIVITAVFWAQFLEIYHGAPIILLTCVMWFLQDRKTARLIVGSIVSLACFVFSPFYVMSPLSVLGIHMHNGQRGNGNKLLYTWAYPGMLILSLVVSVFIKQTI